MRMLLLPAFCITLLLFANSCKKTASREIFSKSSLIEDARSYFESEIANKTKLPEKVPDVLHRNPPPQRNGVKTVNWGNAGMRKLSAIDVIIAPIKFEKPFLIKSPFSAGKFYSINDISRLIVYKDRYGKFQATVATYYSDDNYKMGGNFSGIIVVENWQGVRRHTYKISGPGHVEELITDKAERYQNDLQKTAVIEVCYSVSGYNYSVDDPDNGEYWSQSLGCTTLFYDDGTTGTTDGMSGDQYGEIGGGGSTSGGSPSEPVVGATPVVTIYRGDNNIGNIADYIKCFSNIPGSDHSYQVKVCVSQPVPGTRETWGLSDEAGALTTVGHTYLVFTESTPSNVITRNIGFYPLTNVNPFSPSSRGVLNNDANQDYDVAITLNITSSQFFQVLDYVQQGNSPGFLFNLNTNNCTSFALNALASAGISLPRTTGSWLNGGGLNPGDLGEDLRSMALSSNMTRELQYASHPNVGNCY